MPLLDLIGVKMIEDTILGVTMSWAGEPTIMHRMKDGTLGILPRGAENLMYGDYYQDGPGTWPKDPSTGKNLPIYKEQSNAKPNPRG